MLWKLVETANNNKNKRKRIENGMQKIRSICVFCGARNQVAETHYLAARAFGRLLTENNIRLVYGGGDCGLMGAIANQVMEDNGKVTGVFPVGLKSIENEHRGLSEIIIVDSMHERKHLMFERSDAFVTLPGGFGTMDETFEIITWRLLNFHHKPIIIYNHEGYYNPWVSLIDNIIAEGFAAPQATQAYTVVDKLDLILPTIETLMG